MTKLEELEAKLNELDTQIQELKQGTEFEPFWEAKSELFYYVESDGTIAESTISNGGNNMIGNYYKTKELAQKALDYKLAEQRLRKAVWNLNKGPAPKIEVGMRNYTIDLCREELFCGHWVNNQVNPNWFWLHTEELVGQLIESHSDDLTIYLHGI